MSTLCTDIFFLNCITELFNFFSALSRNDELRKYVRTHVRHINDEREILNLKTAYTNLTHVHTSFYKKTVFFYLKLFYVISTRVYI